MLHKFRRLLSSEYLLGYTVLGGIVYTNRGDFQDMLKHYRNLLSTKEGQGNKQKWRRRSGSQHITKESDGFLSMLHHPTINEFMDSLRTGDLCFIRYDIGKLSWYNRFRLSLIRRLFQNSFYDDIGVVCKLDGKIVLIFPKSVSSISKGSSYYSSVNNKGYWPNELELVDSKEVLKSLSPECLTVKRLFCDESRRNNIQGVILEALESSDNLKRQAFMDTPLRVSGRDSSYGNQLYKYIKCSEILKDSVFSEGNMSHNVYGETQALDSQEPLREGTKSTDASNDAMINAKLDISANSISTGPMDAYQVCKRVMKDFDIHRKGEEQVAKSKTTSSFLTHVYTEAGLLPRFCRLESLRLEQLLHVHLLPSESTKDKIAPCLSSHVHIFNNNLNRARFENLKELQVGDMLWNRL